MADADSNDVEPERRFHYEPKPSPYAGTDGRPRASGVGPKYHHIRIARADRHEDPARPDPQTPYITGRYQSDSAAGLLDTGDDCLLHVNQAGPYVEGVLVDISHEHTWGKRAAFHRFTGELKGSAFEIREAYPGEAKGRIAVGASGLTVSYEYPFGPDYLLHFRRRSETPTFLDESLDAILTLKGPRGADDSVSRLIALAERVPLSTVEMARIQDGVAADAVDALLRAFFAIGGSIHSYDHGNRANAAQTIEDFAKRLLDPALWPRDQIDLARDYVRTLLALQVSAINDVRKSQLQWLEDVVSTVSGSDIVQRQLPYLETLTGIRGFAAQAEGKPIQRPEYKYRLEFNLKYKGKTPNKILGTLRIGGYYGDLIVTAVKSPAWTGRPPQKFKVLLAGGGVAAGKADATDIKATADMTTSEEWTPADFPGWIKLFEGGMWAAKKPKIIDKRIGVGLRDAAVVIHGRENHPEAILGLQGVDESRTGRGAEFNANIGRIFDLDHDLSEEDFTRPRHKVDSVVHTADRQQAFFDFGCAPVNKLGRRVLRTFCAHWLPWLQSSTCTLRIVGHADTVDTAEFNQMLSELRAKNVRQAIRDILGPHLGIPDNQIEVQGQGEAEAAREGPDNTRARRYRRVDIYLDGQLVLTAWSA